MTIAGGGQSTDLLLEVVRWLNDRGIRYAVIGAMAVSVHGVVRASVDSDAVVAVGLEQLREFGRLLTAQGFKTELRQGDALDPIPALLIVSDEHENRVDLRMGLRGLDPLIYERVVEVRLPEFPCALRVACKEDVIAMKLFAGGPLDLMDASRLLTVAGNTLNRELLRHLVERFGKDAVANYEKLLVAK